ASNIELTKDTVAYVPTHHIIFQQLGIDNKLYVAQGNNSNKIEIIHAPDSLGAACNFEADAITLPSSYRSFPYFPHYRLAALAEPCDTTSSVQSAVNSKQVQVYPNPARERLHLESSEVLQKGVFVLFNLAGREMLRQEVFGTQTEIKVEGMAEGMYFYRIFEGEKQVGYGKVIITK
ncbi:MAG: T9SS type A sorting domain-containing protein, partial [Bacteroidia bacterium]